MQKPCPFRLAGYADQIIDYLPVGLLITDAEFRVLHANPYVIRLLGLQDTPCLGQPLLALLPVPDLLSQAKQVLRGEQPLCDLKVNLPGKQLHVKLSGTPQTNEQIQLLLLVSEDRSESAQLEETLHATQELFSLLQESIKDYAIVVTNPEGRVTHWNTGAERIYGFRAGEIVGKLAHCLFTPEDRAAGIPEQEMNIARTNGRAPDNRWHLRQDGTRFYSTGMVTPIRDAAGGLRGYVKVVQDTTALKQAEEEIRRLNAELEQRVQERTAELVAVNQELEAFSYAVSHDLRAPLRAINGFSHAIEEDCGESLDAACKADLQRVRQATMRMSQLIDDLLTLAQVSRGEMHWANLSLSELAAQVADALRANAPERAIEFIIAPELWVRGDAHLLRIALENLLGNAWKYTSRTEHARIELGASKEQGQTVYFVRDNGAGFDMGQMGKLFQPFQRLHNTKEFEGTGVGLSTVQRIIRRHGGKVWAEASPGKGATFYFTLSR